MNTILEYVDKKEQGLVDKVFVTGCLSERYRPDLEKEIPNVDQYFVTTELPLLLKALGADYKHELLGERLTTTTKNYAYLKIAEGCDRPCSFCAIPLMRGKHVSQPIEKLVNEAKGLAKKRSKRININCARSYLLWIGFIQKTQSCRIIRKSCQSRRHRMDSIALCVSKRFSNGRFRFDETRT